MSYSANDKLRDFGQSLGFKVYIFDDPATLGPEILLRDGNKDQEIDAILLRQNVILFVGINSGSGQALESREIKSFFEGLDKTDDPYRLNLKIAVTKKRKKEIDQKIAAANEQLEEVTTHIKEHSTDYSLILRKLFFAPSKRLDDAYLQDQRNKGEFVIEKDTFQYFLEVLKRLNKDFLFYDFMHFLNIRKVEIEKVGASKISAPEKTAPYNATYLPLQDKMKMYSCAPRVEDIMEYVTVLRVAHKYDKKGFQRMVKASRLEKINENYLSKNETFPNNIIIALNPGLYRAERDFYDPTSSRITFLKEFNSLIIIDGQHRFFSFVKGGKERRHILVTFIFFLGDDKEEVHIMMDRMFYHINKNQERIDPNLAFSLIAKIEPDSEENFWYTVFKRLNEKGFFSDRFSFKESTLKGDEGKKSIVSVVTYGGVLTLNKPYKRKGIEVQGLKAFYDGDRNQNLDFAFTLLQNYFGLVEKILHSQRVDKNSLSPREIGGLIRLIRQFLITDGDMVKALGKDGDMLRSRAKEDLKVVEYFEKILKCIPFQKTIELGYPTSNWAAIEGYMLRQIHRAKKQFGNKNLLSHKGLEVYSGKI